MQLDSHNHLWKYDASQYPWMEHGWPIRQNFLPADLQPLLARNGLHGSIVVQARQSLEETRWLLELANQHDFIRAVVGWVDLQSELIDSQLAGFASHPKFAGVRHVVQDEPDDDFLARSEFRRGIGKLARLGLTYDLLIYPRQLRAAIDLVAAFPNQPFVLDHLAKPQIRTGALSPWQGELRELARYANVHCKLSGLVTEATWNHWRPQDFTPYFDVALAAFGPSRLMFGSDWPVCLLSANYDQVAGLVRMHIGSLAADDQAAIMGRNAERFYLSRNHQ